MNGINLHVHIDMRKDVGLAAALGRRIAQFAVDLPEKTLALLVVTHSRAIVSSLLPLGPTCVRVGNDLRPTAQWLADGDLPMSDDDLDNLQQVAVRRFRAVSAVLKGLPKKTADERVP